MVDLKEEATSNQDAEGGAPPSALTSIDETNDELKEIGRWTNMLKLIASILGIVALTAIVALIVVLVTTKNGKSVSTKVFMIFIQ